eukprot:15465089-Alexandrium_andersonii.AAC.1
MLPASLIRLQALRPPSNHYLRECFPSSAPQACQIDSPQSMRINARFQHRATGARLSTRADLSLLSMFCALARY